MKMKLKIKKLHKDAVIPLYARPGDAGLDLVATSKHYDEHGNVVYKVGLAFEIPEGHVGLLFPRSSVSKYDLALTNSVGVIDSGYRGEVMLKYKPALCFCDSEEPKDSDTWGWISHAEGPLTSDEYQIGDKVGQLIIIPIPTMEIEEVEELSETERGEGGYGSTGK